MSASGHAVIHVCDKKIDGIWQVIKNSAEISTVAAIFSFIIRDFALKVDKKSSWIFLHFTLR